MKSNILAAIGAIPLVIGVSVGVASPSAAEPAPSWTMPDVKGGTFEAAMDTIAALISPAAPTITPVIVAGYPSDILSPANWVVCKQSPGVGGTVKAKSNFKLSIARPNECP